MSARPLRLAGMLMTGALIGKLLGFAREIEMARLLGASVLVDSFRGALTAVLLPVALLQGELLPSVLIPLHRRWKEKARSHELSTAMLVLFTILSVLAALAVYAFAGPWVGVLVGGFSPEAHDLTVRFVKVMALSVPASVIAACLSSIEIATGGSRIASTRASVQNLSMMIGILIMAATGWAIAIAWSFVAAMNLMALYAIFLLWRAGEITPHALRLGALAEIGAMFFHRVRPLLAVPLADQGNILLERLLASGAIVGTLSSLEYARTLTDSALYLVSQPIGYVLLTREVGDAAMVRQRVRVISQRMLAIAIPASVFLAVFATDITRMVFARGAFDAHAVALTAGALRGISFGLWAATLGWILIRIVNASGRNGQAAIVVILALALNAVVNLVAVRHLGAFGLGMGEAARGVVLLGGTALALGCGGVLLRCVAMLAPVAAGLALAGIEVCAYVDSPLQRLALGSLISGLTTAALLCAVLPWNPWRALMSIWRPRLRLAANPRES